MIIISSQFEKIIKDSIAQTIKNIKTGIKGRIASKKTLAGLTIANLLLSHLTQ